MCLSARNILLKFVDCRTAPSNTIYGSSRYIDVLVHRLLIVRLSTTRIERDCDTTMPTLHEFVDSKEVTNELRHPERIVRKEEFVDTSSERQEQVTDYFRTAFYRAHNSCNMRRPLISVLLLYSILLCCIVHIGRGSVLPARRRAKRDGSTRLSGRGGVDVPTDLTSLITCLLPGLSDLICIGPRVTLFEPKQLSSTGDTGRAFGVNNGADLRFLAPHNVPYVGENTNAGTFTGAKVADRIVEFGQETNILNFFKAGIFANIGFGNRNGNYPPNGGGGSFPGSSIVPGSDGFTGEGSEKNPFPNYIPPPSSSKTGQVTPSNRPFPNYVPPPPTRVRVPAPTVDYDYTDQASKFEQTTEPDPFDPFSFETTDPPPPKDPFLSETPQPPFFPITSVPELSTDFAPTEQTPESARISEHATPIPIGDELVPFVRARQRSAPTSCSWCAESLDRNR